MKYQYNNVMALLKAQKEMQKNLETVRSSAGWADEQVGLQQETITRQIMGLKADLEQFVVTLEKIGANKAIANTIKDIRSLIAILNEISPEGFNTMIFGIKGFLTIQGFDLFQSNISKCGKALKEAGGIVKWLTAVDAKHLGMLQRLSIAFSRWSGILSAGFIIISAGMAIYDALIERNRKLAESLDVNKVTSAFSDLSNKTKDINELNKAIQDNQAIIQDSTKADSEKAKAEKVLSDSKAKLLELLPKEAQERVRASGYSKEAIDRELNLLYKLQEQKMLESKNAIKTEISKTQIIISQTDNRITAYTEEIKALIARNEMLAKSSEIANKFGFDGITDEYGNNYEEQNKESLEYFKNLKTEAEQLKKDSEQKIKDLEQQLKDLEQSYKVNIRGAVGGIVGDDDNSSNGGNNNRFTYNNSDKTARLAYQTERNRLWYEGNIKAKAYENSLKEITNLEQLYGVTVTSINAKEGLYSKYLTDLQAYKVELEKFRNSAVIDLDLRISGNKALSEELEYSNELTLEEKLRIFEVNKERFQELKTLSTIIDRINEVNQKLEETRNKELSINLELERANQLKFQQKIKDIENETKTQLAVLNRPTNYRYESQKLELELNEARRLLSEHNAEIARLREAKHTEEQASNQIEVDELQNSLNEKLRIREQLYSKIAELEYQKNYNIRSGWADITQQFIIQGNSLKSIWNNLWRDLAREAIQRLFQVQVQASFLGSLFGLFGSGSTPMTLGADKAGNPIQIAGNGDIISNVPHRRHTGGNIGVYPKMHSGGMVEKGRVGVTPKLSNDEVIRTLQVGEEVNSIKERRSNEILASVAMKAIDSKYQQPTNVNITALDSRSFAEYMNDNADILMAVLNKQGALGR